MSPVKELVVDFGVPAICAAAGRRRQPYRIPRLRAVRTGGRGRRRSGQDPAGDLVRQCLGRLEGIYYGPEQARLVSNNLILLGVPDANWATRLVADAIGGVIEFGDPASHNIAITDRGADKVFIPDIDHDGRGTDYGAIKYGPPNPYQPLRKVLIVAGAYGYGTWLVFNSCRKSSSYRNPRSVKIHSNTSTGSM